MGWIMTLADEFLNRVRGRLIHRNKNWLAIICGETGSGKSYSALSIADNICPRGITVRRNVVLDPIGFMNKIANKKDLKRGDILIFDEAGVGLASRDWYSIQNKLLGSVLQTFRHLNIGVIFTTPNLSFIDIQARKLFHNYFETIHIDYKQEMAYLKIYDIQHNSRYDKTYYKHPKFVREGKAVSMGFIGVPKPRASLIIEYEKVKSEFTAKLNEKVLKELTEPKQAKKGYDIKEIIKEVKSNAKDYLKDYHGNKIIDADKIIIKYGLNRSLAYTIKKGVEESLKT
jgi:ABC-type dipeptide/oligopeptide/nickel transport system ATPase component